MKRKVKSNATELNLKHKLLLSHNFVDKIKLQRVCDLAKITLLVVLLGLEFRGPDTDLTKVLP